MQAIAAAQPPPPYAEPRDPSAHRYHRPKLGARDCRKRPQKRDVRYTVTQVGVLPGYESSFVSVLGTINNGGFVAGYSYNGQFDAGIDVFYLTSSAFIGDHRRLTRLPTPAGYAAAFAWGLNDNNQVFGVANKLDDSGNLSAGPGSWDQHGNPTLLENLPGTPYYDDNAMNNRGDVVGTAYLPPDYLATVPVYWHQGSIAQLPLPNGAVGGWANAINDPGVIAGYVDFGTAPSSRARPIPSLCLDTARWPLCRSGSG